MRTIIMRALAIAAAFTLDACNSGGGDPVSACGDYCHHVASCEGLSGSAIDTSCDQACSDAGALVTTCKVGSAGVTSYYNCLAGLPCGDFTSLDGGGVSALLDCAQQSGCQ